jgi:hypothetical protein
VGRRGVGFIALCLVVAAGAAAAPASAATFTNSTTIADPSGGPGVAIPYPSAISVAGLPGTVVKARVTLTDVLALGSDMDVLLTGPGASSLVVSDPCASSLADFGHINLTFDDDAAAPLPETCLTGPQSGTYRPTNYDTADSFPSVAAPYPIGLANFRGISPSGLWQLYVFDDHAPDAVSVGGWTLELTTTGAQPAPTTGTAPTTPTTKRKCKKHKHRPASAAKKRCKKKRR